MGCPFLLQGIFLTRGSNPGLPHCRQTLLPSEPPGNPLKRKKTPLNTSHLKYPKSCLTLCDHMDCSTPGFSVLHYLPKFAQTHVHCVSDAIQSSYPLSPLFPPVLNLSQHQGFFPVIQLFVSSGQSIGASASALVLQ